MEHVEHCMQRRLDLYYRFVGKSIMEIPGELLLNAVITRRDLDIYGRAPKSDKLA
jgi:hypothetical protein